MPITLEYAREIGSWKYEGEMDEDILMNPYFVTFEETGILKGPGGCDGYVAFLDNQLSGLFEFIVKESIIEIGLALNPKLVGKGFGAEFVNQGIEFGVQHYDTNLEYIKLVVNPNNKAAIRVYEKTGFEKIVQSSDEIEMRRDLQK